MASKILNMTGALVAVIALLVATMYVSDSLIEQSVLCYYAPRQMCWKSLQCHFFPDYWLE